MRVWWICVGQTVGAREGFALIAPLASGTRAPNAEDAKIPSNSPSSAHAEKKPIGRLAAKEHITIKFEA
jgi:hypothetical protein